MTHFSVIEGDFNFIEFPTYRVVLSDKNVSNNRVMFSLVNTNATTIVRLERLYLINVQRTNNPNSVLEFNLRRTTGHSGGSNETGNIVSNDTTNPPTTGISVRYNCSVTGLSSNFIWREHWSSDEWRPGGLDQEGLDHAIQIRKPMIHKGNPNEQPVVLRQNEGVALIQDVNSNRGLFDIIATFTMV